MVARLLLLVGNLAVDLVETIIKRDCRGGVSSGERRAVAVRAAKRRSSRAVRTKGEKVNDVVWTEMLPGSRRRCVHDQ